MITNEEYEVLLNLYHEDHDAFLFLPDYIKQAFFNRLYGRD